MYTVLLSGGSGKRLWPLSNDLRSKQYIKLIQDSNGKPESMIQRVWNQLTKEGLQNSTIITAGKSHLEIIKSQLGLNVKIAIEPGRRDTFPAIALSCAYLKSKCNASENDTVVILPVDPYTEQSFFKTVSKLEWILNNSGADVALIGAKPTYPSEKYGYMIPKDNNGEYITIRGFKEKPTLKEAEALIKQHALWNCGVFCFRLGYILDNVRARGLSDEYDELYNNYNALPKTSFDYEVLEKCSKICAVQFDDCWKDLGTWNTLTEEMKTKSFGNCIMSDSCENTNVINELEIPVIVIGTKNLVIAVSADGILVSEKHESSYLKDYTRDIDMHPMYEERRWGYLKVLDINKKGNTHTMTRRVLIKKDMNSSLHYHERRDEMWNIVSGNGELFIDNVLKAVSAGDCIRINKNVYHAIRAFSDLEIIEVQIGESVGAEDIIRIEYNWDQIINHN